MKTHHKMALAALAGVAIGTAAPQTIRGQQVKTAPAYVIAEVAKDPTKTQDPAAAQKYRAETPKTLIPYGGRYLVVGGKVQAVEGEGPKGQLVIIAFDSLEKARGWYDSPAYEAIKAIRRNSTNSRILIAEGVAAR